MKTILTIILFLAVAITAYSEPPKTAQCTGRSAASDSSVITNIAPPSSDSLLVSYGKLLDILVKQHEEAKMNLYKIEGAIETVQALIEDLKKSLIYRK